MKRVSEDWYKGTADAVYQNIYSIGSERSKYALLLSGDHIYKMNYELMLEQHIQSGADVTLATILIDPSESRSFGVVETRQRWPRHRISGEAQEDRPPFALQPGDDFGLNGHLSLQY